MTTADEHWGHDPEAFKFTKTFRDPVWGDIQVKALEVSVTDTVAFQRLRGIKQLGTAEFVYHGATHTRFALGWAPWRWQMRSSA